MDRKDNHIEGLSGMTQPVTENKDKEKKQAGAYKY
jgi:hypothetical protein